MFPYSDRRQLRLNRVNPDFLLGNQTSLVISYPSISLNRVIFTLNNNGTHAETSQSGLRVISYKFSDTSQEAIFNLLCFHASLHPDASQGRTSVAGHLRPHAPPYHILYPSYALSFSPYYTFYHSQHHQIDASPLTLPPILPRQHTNAHHTIHPSHNLSCLLSHYSVVHPTCMFESHHSARIYIVLPRHPSPTVSLQHSTASFLPLFPKHVT